MDTLQLFAHSEDLHSADTSQLEHLLTSAEVALPLYVAANLLLFVVLRKYRKSAIMPAILGLNLVAGVMSYSAVPAVSVAAITVGIASALLISLSLLANN